jgi:dTDP-4-amino-4,6-dideoxygalactose transaminase
VIPFGDLRRQHATIANEVEAAIIDTLRSGWFVLGERGRRFEEAFAWFCGAAHAVGVASGTEAIQLALMAVGVGPGDEVVTVSNTCVPTAAAITACGAAPRLVDIEPETQTMDPARVADAIGPRTKAILPVHLYGQCADLYPILEVARQAGVPVVEDCAQAHGAFYRGRHAGTFGAAGAFSFYPSKNLGADGDAGMVITNDAGLAERLRELRNYGQRDRYHHRRHGLNSRLDEVQAAILLAKLPHLHNWLERRREIAERYLKAIADSQYVDPPMEAAHRRHAWHLFVVRVDDRPRFQDHMKASAIETLIHYRVPIHRQEAYAHLAGEAMRLPVTEAQKERIVSVPIYPELTDEEVTQIAGALCDYRDR